MNEDLTKVGSLPKKQGRRNGPQLTHFHCVDHTSFRESCHNCLVKAVNTLLNRVRDLEDRAHDHTERTIPIQIRGKNEAQSNS
jgi:hypothetical protein